MSTRVGRKLALIVGVASCAALGAVGCLGGDDTKAPGGGIDAGRADSAVPVVDAGPAPGNDAAAFDAGPTPDAGPPPADAGVDAPPPGDSGITGTAGLVVGGVIARSQSFVMTGAASPATGGVMRSSKYQLVGGIGVGTQTATKK